MLVGHSSVWVRFAISLKLMNNIIPLFGSSRHEISVFKPGSFEEAQHAINQLKLGQPIMLNISELPHQTAQRITDFVSGSVSILSGQSVNVGNGVFLYSLSDIEVAGFQEERIA